MPVSHVAPTGSRGAERSDAFPLPEPNAVALVRIGLGVATVLNAYEMHELFMRLAAGGMLMPFGSIPVPEPSNSLVWASTALGVVAGLALVFGWRSSFWAFVAVLLNLWLFAWDQQSFSNHRHLTTVLLLLLVFTRSDRRWSLRKEGWSHPTPWPIVLMKVQLSVLYFFAAVAKINPSFLSGIPMDHWVRLDLPDVLTMSMAWGTIVVELFMAFGLWFRRTRALAVIFGVLLHGSIVLLMAEGTLALVSFAAVCVPLYPLFWLRAPSERRSSNPTLQQGLRGA